MALQLAALAIVSVIAHFTRNSIFWLLAGAMSTVTGFYWFDRFNNNLGLSISIFVLLYGLTCIAIGFRQLFTRTREILANRDE